MDANKIFGLFDDGDSELENKKVQYDDILLDDYKKHPLFWVGMFKKLIYNHNVFKEQLLKFFEKSDEKLDKSDIDKAGEFIVFGKAWDFIKNIYPDNKEHQEALYHFSDLDLKIAFELSIKYFQEQEEYEKCAHLKKNLDFLKLLLT
jgi:uncharacterized membrane protein (UPF0182 family)